MGSNISLLIVDDEEELIENILYDIKSLQFRTYTANNGVEGLKILKDNPIDIILSDIKMPKKDGIQFASEARAFGYEKPLIFLTAHGDDKLMRKALSLGAFDFIDKPYNQKSLLEILTEASKEVLSNNGQSKNDASLESDFETSYKTLLKKKNL